jgi:uncharacterized protein YggT (Ycf19 family)
MPPVLTIARYVVFGAVALAAIAGVASWLVRERRVSPFGPLGRVLRNASDPFLHPVEARLLRMGGNPRNAGWWLIVGIAVVGLLSLALLGWVVDAWFTLSSAVRYGPRGIAFVIVNWTYAVLVAALWVRVIGSWFGAFRYNRWVRPAYLLTDWIVEPLRRVLPRFGAFDWSPLAAWAALWMVKTLIVRIV